MAKKNNRSSERKESPVLTGHDSRCREREEKHEETSDAKAPDGISGNWG